MDSSNDIATRIMAMIATLPPEEQAKTIHSLIDGLLKGMPRDQIGVMRAEIAGQLDESFPIIRSTLELIDGHIALREMGLAEEPPSHS